MATAAKQASCIRTARAASMARRFLPPSPSSCVVLPWFPHCYGTCNGGSRGAWGRERALRKAEYRSPDTGTYYTKGGTCECRATQGTKHAKLPQGGSGRPPPPPPPWMPFSKVPCAEDTCRHVRYPAAAGLPTLDAYQLLITSEFEKG